MNAGVYMITNTVNGKIYIGSAVNMRRRWREHVSRLRGEAHENTKLQRAWLKYGEVAFVFSVVATAAEKLDRLALEQHLIDERDSVLHGYNISTIATGGSGGKRVGVAYENIVAANKRRAGRVASDATKARQSAAQLGRKHAPETLEKISLGNKRKIIPEEQRRALSAAMMGNKRCLGRRLSVETREKISASHRRRGIDTMELSHDSSRISS